MDEPLVYMDVPLLNHCHLSTKLNECTAKWQNIAGSKKFFIYNLNSACCTSDLEQIEWHIHILVHIQLHNLMVLIRPLMQNSILQLIHEYSKKTRKLKWI